MPSRRAIALLLLAFLAAFVASELAFRERVLAPSLGSEIAGALSLAAFAGALVASLLLWVGWKRG
jgi:hypothetical protein